MARITQCTVSMAEEHHEFWFYNPSQQFWAVEIRDGSVVRACGPFQPQDAARLRLEALPYRTVNVPWINDRRAEFVHARRRTGASDSASSREERCSLCELPILEGEGRYRYVSRVLHARCAEADGPRPPG